MKALEGLKLIVLVATTSLRYSNTSSSQNWRHGMRRCDIVNVRADSMYVTHNKKEMAQAPHHMHRRSIYLFVPCTYLFVTYAYRVHTVTAQHDSI